MAFSMKYVETMKRNDWAKAATRTFGAMAATMLLGLVAVAPAQAQVAERGHQIAERWCSSCHAVDRGQTSRTPAPSFPDIAKRHGDERKWVRAWLMASHPSMPDMNLSRLEIADVVAYLESLLPRKAE